MDGADFGLVDPADVRWVFLSHDDSDHTGNLAPVLDLCPNATLVTSWFANERMSGDLVVPPHRQRWVNDGESFDAGDRTLRRGPAADVRLADHAWTVRLVDRCVLEQRCVRHAR